MSPRLRSDITAAALMQTARGAGAFATVLHKGHEEGGMLHLVLRQRDGVEVWSETKDTEGRAAWRRRPCDGTDAGAEAVMARERAFDTDLWVIEIDGLPDRSLLPGTFLQD